MDDIRCSWFLAPCTYLSLSLSVQPAWHHFLLSPFGRLWLLMLHWGALIFSLPLSACPAYNWLICCRAIDRDNSRTNWEDEEIVPSTRSLFNVVITFIIIIIHTIHFFLLLRHLQRLCPLPTSSSPCLSAISVAVGRGSWERSHNRDVEFTVNGFLLVRCLLTLPYLSYTHLLLCRARVFTINLIIMRPATLYVVRSAAWIH